MSRRRHALALLAALASACTCAGPPSPVVTSVSPALIAAGTAADVSVGGSGFAPWVEVDLEDPAASTVRGAFALTLVLANQRIPLERVAFVSEHELSARVPPLVTPADYDLELVDPRGRIAVLPAALRVDPSGGCGPDGTPCDDGNVCTDGDTCQGGTCAPGASVCVNTAPRACLTVSPSAVEAGQTVALDASCSADGEDAPAALRARIDFGDGFSETSFGPAGIREHAYPTPGLWVATVEVQDGGGLSDFASRYVLVTAAGDLVLVTTAVDEADAGATPGAPGGTGLSLREAIAYVNALGAPRTIRVAVAEPIVHAAALPSLDVGASAIVGDPAAPLAFPDAALACLTLDGPDQLLLAATVTGCLGTAVMLGNGSDGARVAECTITPSAKGSGITAKAAGNAIGPRNLVSGGGTGVKLNGSPASPFVLEENRIEGNDVGIFAVSGADLTVRRNRVTSNRTVGLQATPSSGTCTLLHNVFDANGQHGADLGTFAGGIVVRNNLFTRNGGAGLRVTAATADHNGFFANGLGAISDGTTGPTDVLEDPLYAGEHRLSPGSPAIDRGLVTELDVNGPAAGDYSGAAPDLGAWEAPYPAP